MPKIQRCLNDRGQIVVATWEVGYLHGYSRDEQERLYHQAEFLESIVFPGVPFKDRKHLIEVGCGVGAQTKILARRFPKLKIDSVDLEPAQLARAAKHLEKEIKKGRVRLHQANAEKLPFTKPTFDSAFLCWFLEHVPRPVKVLKEVHRVLKPKAKIICTEVLNQIFYIHPYSPATLHYWFLFNDHQWNLGGDPFVGAKLGNYLKTAGFKNIETHTQIIHLDNREPVKRAKFIEYWTDLLLSGAPQLTEAKLIAKSEIAKMTKELERLRKDPESVFFAGAVQANAVR